MAESIPAIRVTDPQSRDTIPQSPPAQTPTKAAHADNGGWTAVAREGRPNSPNGITSPGKLLRSLSNSVAYQANGQTSPKAEDPASPGSLHSAIDPLSQHILSRTQPPQGAGPPLLRPTSSAQSGHSGTSDEKSTEDGNPPQTRQSLGRSETASTAAPPKEKKKGVSFLSRIIGGKKKEASVDVPDDASQYSDLRPEAMEAQVFTQPVDNIGYAPRHPQPPAYIRVRAKYKKEKDFDRLFLAQELYGTKQRNDTGRSGSATSRRGAALPEQDTVWAMQFSRDGKYLAAAGHDKVLRVWAVITNAEERRSNASNPSTSPEERNIRLSAPVFRSEPIRQFEGHSATILDLSWSKNNFLLSSSMDRTVRLWHVSRSECLCTFKHNDFVTSIAFHPRDDRFFLAGSLDSKLRLWSIPDKTVAFWNQLPDMITAVAFTPDGKYAMAGCLTGLCMFYETEGLKYQTQIHVRSTHGKNAKGSKITGIRAFQYPPHTPSGDTKLLISSNDSRIRMYNFRDKSMEVKFKGNINDSSQIRATLSDDARYIACGSEDHRAYIWSLDAIEGEKRHKRPMEVLEASNTIITCIAFAPAKTRQVLGRSEDPIYDLCNPPPITLTSKDEPAQSHSSSKALTDDGDTSAPAPTEPEVKPKKPEESPAYIARSGHTGGNIIVTADFSGKIKVFRQDCAWQKRRNDSWETSSVFSKRMGSSKLGRSASIATKGSSRSLRSTQGSNKTQEPSDRILSWRQGVSSTPSIKNGSIRSSRGGRSASPPKPAATQARPASSRSSMGPPPVPDKQDHSKTSPEQNGSNNLLDSDENDPNPLRLQGDRSMLFYKLARDTAMANRRHHEVEVAYDQQSTISQYSGERQGLSPMIQRQVSAVSRLSIERSSGEESDSDVSFKDAPEDVVICSHCGSTSFTSKSGTGKHDADLICAACGNSS